MIETNEEEFQQLDILQFVYSGIRSILVCISLIITLVGHGIYNTTAELGEFLGEDDDETTFMQKGHIGDCIVNTDGTKCSELCLEVLLARAVNENALISMFFDMCRTENKVKNSLRHTIFILKNSGWNGSQKTNGENRLFLLPKKLIGPWSRSTHCKDFFFSAWTEVEGF